MPRVGETHSPSNPIRENKDVKKYLYQTRVTKNKTIYYLPSQDPIGDLDEPVTVQVVHLNRQRYHFGVFQLNTLNLNPSTSDGAPTTRNLFWTQPWEMLFDSCKFKVGKPVLEGYNPKVFSLLRGLHVQG